MTTRNLIYATLVVIVGLVVFNLMADAATAHHVMSAAGAAVERQPASITTVRWVFAGIGATVLLVWFAAGEYADRHERALQARRAQRKT